MFFSDDLVSSIADYLKENPWLLHLGFGSLILGFFGSILMKYLRGKSSNDTTSKPKKKEK